MSWDLGCRQASRLMSAQQDRELSLADATRLRLHLAICSTCRQVNVQFGFLRQALRRMSDPPDDPPKDPDA